MSQAMLMRIINLEKRVDALLEAILLNRERISALEDIAHASTAETDIPGWVPESMKIVESLEPVDMPFVTGADRLPYHLFQHGVGWFRVFGPEGEVTEKGLRRHEAQALADDLNAQ